MLFASWAGVYGRPLTSTSSLQEEEKCCTELQLSALQAMSGLLCCGSCFNPQSLSEEGAILYQWLDSLLASKDEKVSSTNCVRFYLQIYYFLFMSKSLKFSANYIINNLLLKKNDIMFLLYYDWNILLIFRQKLIELQILTSL
jgi:hypothetical protein